MNNKEFQVELAKRLNISQKRSAELVKGYVDTLVQQLVDADELPLFSLGAFEVKHKEQRVIVNPTSKTYVSAAKISAKFQTICKIKK